MLCIKNGRLVLPDGVREADLYIQGDKIFSIGGYIAGADEFDAKGSYVFPGFIDAHTHLGTECARIPTADDFASGTEAALAGGTTCIVDFAAQKRGGSLLEAADTWAKMANGRCSCDYGFHMAVTDWSQSTARELRRLSEAGICSFKAFMAYDALRLEDNAIRKLMHTAADIGFVGVHCELGDEVERNVRNSLNAGDTRPIYHTMARPNRVEALAVRRCLELAGEAGVPVWIVHISTAESMEEIRTARRRGQYVLAETCPQYLTLTNELLLQETEESAKYVCCPPLRSHADVEALWQALAAGEIQLVSTDHCSFTAADKVEGSRRDFAHIPAGLPGLEYRPALMWTQGVAGGRIGVTDMARLLAEYPAKAMGLYPRKGVLRAGADADLVIWDPEWQGEISAERAHSKAGYTPWEGWAIQGRPAAVFLRGVLAAARGQVLRFGLGRFTERKPVF